MEPGATPSAEGPSETARRVAAHRLSFDRLAAPYGDPEADRALARDVAGPDAPAPSDLMAPYLRGRTAFFDRVVVNALDRGVSQVLNVGAGYDGRPFRYARAGVRWWEVDRAGTQSDKRSRLARLGIADDHVAFVPHDLAHPGLAHAVMAAGYEPDAPSLLMCEGVAVYLEETVVEGLLDALRSLATVGTRLAISLGTSSSSADDAARRARFETAVAAMGEPARSRVSAEGAEALLARTRWRPVDVSERARRAGFVVAAPVWAPPGEAAAPTRSTVGVFMEEVLHRTGAEDLGAHLEAAYGVPVTAVRELDLGVHLVRRADGSAWVARVFPASRPVGAVEADAVVLGWLADSGVPAERCAAQPAVSVHRSQPVLVTAAAEGRTAKGDPGTLAELGALLGRMHTLGPGPAAARRPGGAWHHLVADGGPGEERSAALALLGAAGRRVPAADRAGYRLLLDDLEALDDLADLPIAFGHPDLVPRNVIRGSDGTATLIDWAGCGAMARMLSLGCLLWAASGRAGVRAATEGYTSVVTVDGVEIDRMEAAMRRRPWSWRAGAWSRGGPPPGRRRSAGPSNGPGSGRPPVGSGRPPRPAGRGPERSGHSRG